MKKINVIVYGENAFVGTFIYRAYIKERLYGYEIGDFKPSDKNGYESMLSVVCDDKGLRYLKDLSESLDLEMVIKN